jgi:hypothetical protein
MPSALRERPDDPACAASTSTLSSHRPGTLSDAPASDKRTAIVAAGGGR